MNADSTILNRWKFFTGMMNRITYLPLEQYNFSHSTFLSISAQFGRIGKGRPGRIWEYEILCLLFSPVNQTAEILPLPSISFPFPRLPTILSTAWEREREKEKVLGIRQSNQVQRSFSKKKKSSKKTIFFVFFIF